MHEDLSSLKPFRGWYRPESSDDENYISILICEASLSKILILGAMGSLGRHVIQQAISADHEVSIMVRRLLNVPAEVRKKVIVYEADIAEMSTLALATIFRNQDAVINTAGNVTDGQSFVNLTDHIVTSLELIPETTRPVCWFMAGAAVLDMDAEGRKAVDLPIIKSTY